jgi:hypothetical protein
MGYEVWFVRLGMQLKFLIKKENTSRFEEGAAQFSRGVYDWLHDTGLL